MRVYAVRRNVRARRVWSGVVLILVVAVGVLVYALVSQRTVVPGLSARLHPIHHKNEIARVAERYGVDPYLVAAVARTESGWDAAAVSRAGAVGLMQLMPATADWLVGLEGWKGPKKPELTDPKHSLELGAFYLAYLLERFAGDRRAAVAAYNAGPNIVSRWLSAGGGKGLEPTDVVFPETRAFVQKVEDSVALYKNLHPGIFGRSGEAGG